MFFSYHKLVINQKGRVNLPKFKFTTSKKNNKFNFITDKSEILNTEIINGTHIEIFSNEKIILEGCRGIIDYENNYIKLQLKKGHIIIIGTDFLISAFENERITVNGKIVSLEFCI